MIAVLLGGCGSGPPLPSIVSVEPQRLSTSESVQMTVRLEGGVPLRVDYSERSAELFPLTYVSIADRKLPIVEAKEQGRLLIVELLPGLPVGPQDLRIEFQDGQQVVREKGFEVTPPLQLTGFVVEPIGPQAVETPFSITLRAVGQDAALFRSRVKLYSNNGTVEPEVSRPFEAGVLTQEITVDNIGPRPVSILVEDYVGHTGRSNEFSVSAP